MIKTGIFHWYGYIQPFEERIKLIKQSEYDYIMLWWEDEKYPCFIDRRELIKIVKESGLEIDNVHLPYDDYNLLWSEDSSKRLKQTATIVRWLNECKNSGIDTVVMHATNGSGVCLNYMAGYNSFNEILKTAENIGLIVALENTQMFEYTDFLFTELDTKCLGFCYDSSHDYVNGESRGEILDKWKEKLCCVHLSDNDGICDRHWIPGSGNVEWKKIISVIKKSNIRSFSMETYPNDEEKNLKPIDFLVKARQNLMSQLV